MKLNLAGFPIRNQTWRVFQQEIKLGGFSNKKSNLAGFLIIPGGEALAGEGLLAMGAGEALPVPWVVAISHAALGDHLKE